MTTIRYAEGFKNDLLRVESDRVLNGILNATELLMEIPTMGSRNLPRSITKTFGNDVRKLVVNPFDVIYRYDEEADVVRVVGIGHRRTAW